MGVTPKGPKMHSKSQTAAKIDKPKGEDAKGKMPSEKKDNYKGKGKGGRG